MAFSNPTATACPYVKHVAMYDPLFYMEASRFLDIVIMVITSEASVAVKKHWPFALMRPSGLHVSHYILQSHFLRLLVSKVNKLCSVYGRKYGSFAY